MKADQQLVFFAQCAIGLPVLSHCFFEGRQISFVVMEIADKAHFRLVAQLLQPGAGFVDHGCGGACRVVGIHRHEQDPRRPFGFEPGEDGGD